jgi:beta-galactosidase
MTGTRRIFNRLQFGGDYNPEQWEPGVWDQDVQLMAAASVTLATVGVFSWSRLEPSPGEYDFAWLDDVLDRLHAGGVGVMLATATASPPPWFSRLYPESLPVTAEGMRLHPGSRQHFSPSSSAYRTHALQLVEQVAARYGAHPALVAWHVNNEYGCHVPSSFDEESASAFREWLTARYGTIGELNGAWGTDFWSQRYGSFGEVDPPRAMPAFANPTQLLDFDRFSSDALLALYRAEADVLRRITPDIPVTTNFMGFFRNADYWKWAPHLDFISDDAYPDPADPESYVSLCAQRDLMRSLGDGRSWLLMESATTAVQWRPANATKPPGMHRAQSIQAVARGADGILHFQWRQSAAGAEKFHAAMLPHAGQETRVFREVCSLGAELAELSPLMTGMTVPARVAVILDWDSWRAVEQGGTPAHQDYLAHLMSWYRPFLRRGITVDLQSVGADLSDYALVVAPMLNVAGRADLDALAGYVRGGGHLVVGYQSAILDRDLHAWLGGYLGPLAGTLGVRIEEWSPLVAAPAAATDPITTVTGAIAGTASQWQDVIVVDDAEVLARFSDGFAAGGPAITRRGEGIGVAWYLGTLPDEKLFDLLVDRWAAEAGVEPLLTVPTAGVEAVQRGDTVVVVNHTPAPITVPLTSAPVHLAPFEVHLTSG